MVNYTIQKLWNLFLEEPTLKNLALLSWFNFISLVCKIKSKSQGYSFSAYICVNRLCLSKARGSRKVAWQSSLAQP